jgi:uncharacterized membrane protein (DUF373 family)
MSIKQEFREAREKFRLLSLYQRFEHFVVMFLTALIVVIVVAALWSLTLKILFGLVLSGGLDPSDYSAFQAVFGMILTVIIALEFKKSLLVVAESRNTAVQIRSVVMIALLAICRKVIILDLTETDALHILALAAAILALGLIYWLIGVRDREGDEVADVGGAIDYCRRRPAVSRARYGWLRAARRSRMDRPARGCGTGPQSGGRQGR